MLVDAFVPKPALPFVSEIATDVAGLVAFTSLETISFLLLEGTSTSRFAVEWPLSSTVWSGIVNVAWTLVVGQRDGLIIHKETKKK